MPCISSSSSSIIVNNNNENSHQNLVMDSIEEQDDVLTGSRKEEGKEPFKKMTRLKSSLRFFGLVLLIAFLMSLLCFGLGLDSASVRFAKDNQLKEEEKTNMWIYLKDKGQDINQINSMKELQSIIHKRILTKDRFVNNKNMIEISEKALERRRKRSEFTTAIFKKDETIVSNNDYSIHDIPLYEPYIQYIEGHFLRKDQSIRVKSNWLNAFSITDVTPSQKEKIERLPFVERVEPVISFKKTKEVETIQPVIVSKRNLQQNGIYGVSYEQLEQIRVISTKTLFPNLSGYNITMAVCDSGFHINQHRAFKHLKVIATYDFVNKDTNVDNEPGEDPSTAQHGTSVLSAIAGYDEGYYMGVAPNVTLLLAKTEDIRSETPIEEDNFIAAVEWAEALGADIISASLGYTDWYSHAKNNYNGVTSPLTKVVNIAIRYKGIVAVLAAGNEGLNGIGVPSDAFGAISVGSVDIQGLISSFSSRGPTDDGRIAPSICARGGQTYLVNPYSTSAYQQSSGTSFATPLVAGCVALMLQYNPDWTPLEIRKALTMTASRNNAPDNNYGWGIVNLLSAITYNQSISTKGSTFDDSTQLCPVTTKLGAKNSECGWMDSRGVCFNGECKCYKSSDSPSCDISSSASSSSPFFYSSPSAAATSSPLSPPKQTCGVDNCKHGFCYDDQCLCFYGYDGSDCDNRNILSIASTLNRLLSLLPAMFVSVMCILFSN
ncbi:hypothetical protein ABK040_015203 [Willaertia magna]